MLKKAIFYKKKFLIYGFGKSGYSSFKYLNQKYFSSIPMPVILCDYPTVWYINLKVSSNFTIIT